MRRLLSIPGPVTHPVARRTADRFNDGQSPWGLVTVAAPSIPYLVIGDQRPRIGGDLIKMGDPANG